MDQAEDTIADTVITSATLHQGSHTNSINKSKLSVAIQSINDETGQAGAGKPLL
jgi:hypothetical protein